MVRVVLEEDRGRLLSYSYYPEDGAKRGAFLFDRETLGECEVELSEDDPFSIYLDHALSAIEETLANGGEPTDLTAAWY